MKKKWGVVDDSTIVTSPLSHHQAMSHFVYPTNDWPNHLHFLKGLYFTVLEHKMHFLMEKNGQESAEERLANFWPLSHLLMIARSENDAIIKMEILDSMQSFNITCDSV